MTENTQRVPEGYMEDSQGRLIPISKIKEIDLLRNELVCELVAKAEELCGVLTRFKVGAMGDIESFVALSAEKYGAKLGGRKGNVQLTSFNGAYKVCRDIADHLEFDERLQAAKALIDECINEWAEGSNDNIRVLVTDAFNVDKKGKLNTNRILSLRRLDIDDPKWQRAMTAIGDSLQVAGSKAYLRIYKRQNDGSYRQVNLDLAAL